MRKFASHGFTLIELIVVIAIIGILTALITTNYIGVKQKGRDAQRKSNLQQIRTALEFYRSDLSIYPPSSGAGAFPTTCGVGVQFTGASNVYMQRVPCDPLDTTTIYTYTASPPGCTVNCLTYTLRACFENVNDPQRDGNDGSGSDLCPATGRVSYTIANP